MTTFCFLNLLTASAGWIIIGTCDPCDVRPTRLLSVCIMKVLYGVLATWIEGEREAIDPFLIFVIFCHPYMDALGFPNI